MRMASSQVRPSSSAAPARVLWVGAVGEPWLALSRAARALGWDAVQVPAAPEPSRARPSLVLVDWRQLPVHGPPGAFKARLGLGGAPLVLVAEPETPAEVLELANAEGVDDCLLTPVGEGAARARLATLLASAVPPPASRYTPRVVLLAGASGARAWDGLGAHLEACGHHLLYGATVAGVASRLQEHGAPPHLLVAAGGPASAPWMRASPRARELLEGVPSLTLEVGEGFRAAAVLPRVHALLGREGASLRVEERVSFCCPVEFGETGPRGLSWLSGVSFAMSPAGLFIRTLVPARAGTAVALRIHLPTTGEVLESPGVVAWSNPFSARVGPGRPHGMGVRFLGMGPPRLMHLRQLCQSPSP
ncbi:PilZ domain-containing protein [Myxococcus sp. K15C18031901]|uniref:PilZ domain-containing protein n=1 Tax=Myxococcus dinghuensis TaxID=2906761 RepID=UPI0020A7E703|nr:PilZ domain-containing protein [Myxococcus dinghuensis]MCP3099623.1 PilZ domain-containing protein [Myxococcus dinghuensis]